MVRYRDGDGSVVAPSITGAIVGPSSFYAWEPSTWPHPPRKVDEIFIGNLTAIVNDSMLDEIDNVIADTIKSNGDLQHRGHVIGIALWCALDAISSYGYGD